MKSSSVSEKNDFARRNPDFVKARIKASLKETLWRAKDPKFEKDKSQATIVVAISYPNIDLYQPYERLKFDDSLNRIFIQYESGTDLAAVEKDLRRLYARVPKTTIDGVLTLVKDGDKWLIDKFSDEFALKQSI